MSGKLTRMSTKPYRPLTAVGESGADETAARRRGINSVETGFRVLDALRAMNGPSTLTNLAEAASLDTSQAHRYVSSLVNIGLIRQDPDTGLYDLGSKALELGLAAIARLDTVSVIARAAEALANDRGHTCMLSLWSPNGPVVVRWFAGRPPVYTTLSVGSVMPLTSSATGQVFMSYLGANYLEAGLKDEGKRVPVGRDPALKTIRERVRQRGYAEVDGTVVPGLRAFAAPVFGMQDALLAVITVVGSEATAAKDDPKRVADLLAVCTRLSEDFGARFELSKAGTELP